MARKVGWVLMHLLMILMQSILIGPMDLDMDKEIEVVNVENLRPMFKKKGLSTRKREARLHACSDCYYFFPTEFPQLVKKHKKLWWKRKIAQLVKTILINDTCMLNDIPKVEFSQVFFFLFKSQFISINLERIHVSIRITFFFKSLFNRQFARLPFISLSIVQDDIRIICLFIGPRGSFQNYHPFKS